MSVVVEDVIAFVKQRLPYTVYNSRVPESEENTAVAVYEITHSRSRDIMGCQVNKASFWRLVLVTPAPSFLSDAISKIESMDNSGDNQFQKVYSERVNTEPLDQGSLIQRTFFDLTFYER